MAGQPLRGKHFEREWVGVVVLGALALLVFARVGDMVLAHEPTGLDRFVQAWVLAHQSPVVERVFTLITLAAGITAMSLVTAAGSIVLWHHRRHRAAAGVLLVPVLANYSFELAKREYARPRPNGLGGVVDSSYAFPSGHATAATAVCGTLAYVFWREGFVSSGAALFLAVVPPLLVGASRVYLNVHWTTDVIGGWSAGLFIALLAVATYNRHYGRRPAVPALEDET